MSYYIFTKNLPNVSGTLYRIASDQTYLNYITNFPESYNIIQDNIQNFQDIVFGKTYPDKYNDNNIINYINNNFLIGKNELKMYIDQVCNQLTDCINADPQRGMVAELSSYKTLLKSLDINNIILLDQKGEEIKLTISLEEYLYNLGNNVISPLQIP